MNSCIPLKLWAICLVFFVSNVDLEVPRPRGVPVEKASLYASGAEFNCFDGSAVIPFDQVNDDYCDCPDGSDEPEICCAEHACRGAATGTSACSGGTFHCINAGHSPLDIPSSRVNDGICDCCDGSDEYQSPVACQNTCMELGRAAREEAEKKAKLAAEGYEVYLEYSKQGKQAKQENEARLEELRKQKDDLQASRDELEAKKNEAEAPEKEAKDRHQKKYEEEKEKFLAGKEEDRIVAAFTDLDENGDSVLTIAEMQLRDEFDIDANGETSEEEAKERLGNTAKTEEAAGSYSLFNLFQSQEHLEDNDSVDLDTFRTAVWPNIKAIYQPPQQEQEQQAEEVEPTEQPPPPEHEVYDDYGEEAEDEDEEDFEDLDDDDFHDDLDKKGDDGESGEEFPMPPYDDETQALVDAADAARDVFIEADKKLEDVKREERELQSMLELDLGDAMQFFPLKGQCFEYTDREYIYKFCPFERATQRQRVGGGPETSLGVWGRWDYPEAAPYSSMLYERGQGCWNGPDRSVRILLSCGVKNEVISASEPNRCEYQFEFHTPCACRESQTSPSPHGHTEL